MKSLINYLNGATIDNLSEIKAELEAELNRGAEKAQKNQELYAEAHDVVMAGLERAVNPITVSELYEDIASELPEGFSKGKVQYALLHYWDGEIVKTKGDPNTYSLK